MRLDYDRSLQLNSKAITTNLKRITLLIKYTDNIEEVQFYVSVCAH